MDPRGTVALVRKGKLKFRAHDLRHKFAVTWLKNGSGIYELSRHLGHSSVKTTEIYLAYVGTDPGTATTVSPSKTEAGNAS